MSDEPTVIICSPQGWTYRAIRWCKKCKRRTRQLVTTYVWYDPTARCLAHEKPSRFRPDWDAATTRRDAHNAVVAAAMADLDAISA